MREIGKEVGIKASSIYFHYESKEELFLTVVDDLFKRIEWEDTDHWDLLIKEQNINSKVALREKLMSYYLFFSKNHLELLFWQRIRFFRPSQLQFRFDMNRLHNEKSLVECYLDLFGYGVKTRQLRDENAEVLALSFMIFISGFIDLLILVPSGLTELQINASFELYWDAIRHRG